MVAPDPATAFWASAKHGAVNTWHSIYYVVMSLTARMELIHRTKEEPFVNTVTQMYARNPFTCAINGIQYSVENPNTNRAAVALGKTALDANLTIPDGLLIKQGTRLTGRSAPSMFYV